MQDTASSVMRGSSEYLNQVIKLDRSWRMAAADADALQLPNQLADVDWLPAKVPGTVAGALNDAGKFDPFAPEALQMQDFWYQCDLNGYGEYELHLDGLATHADIYLDARLILTSDNMFHRHIVKIVLRGHHELSIRFRALTQALTQTKPRARWRTQLVSNQALRHVRTTLLGHMPGWCPNIEPVGPWRPIFLVKCPSLSPHNLCIQSELHGDDGRLHVDFDLDGAARVELHCGEHSVAMRANERSFSAIIDIENVRKWWPHTHGKPELYPVWIEADGQRIDLGNTGFRQILLDRGDDGTDFALFCNGIKVFCRGAVWTNADILNLSGTREAYAPFLQIARAANFNMLRMSGTGVYETRAFYDLCAELGLMVWQDFMFANFDYPTANPDFAASAAREADDFLQMTQGCPALAVLCGGSEMYQQAAMMGTSAATWPQVLTETLLKAAGARYSPRH